MKRRLVETTDYSTSCYSQRLQTTTPTRPTNTQHLKRHAPSLNPRKNSRNTHQKDGLVAGLADAWQKPRVQAAHSAFVDDAIERFKQAAVPASIAFAAAATTECPRLTLDSAHLEGGVPGGQSAANAPGEDLAGYAAHFDQGARQLREALPTGPVRRLPRRHRTASGPTAAKAVRL